MNGIDDDLVRSRFVLVQVSCPTRRGLRGPGATSTARGSREAAATAASSRLPRRLRLGVILMPPPMAVEAREAAPAAARQRVGMRERRPAGGTRGAAA